MNEAIKNINSILNKFYSSIESNGYKLLNDIADIDEDIFSKQPLKTIYSDKCIEYINLVINTLVFAFILYYFFKLVISLYSSNEVSNIYIFLSKVILVFIISKNSYSLCKGIVEINYKFTQVIEQIFEDVTDKKINYDFLNKKADTLEEFFELEDKINIKGIGESLICLFILNMIVILSVRYVIVILCIILSPFAILLYINKETRFLFIMWIKLLVFNLLVQIINKFILFIPIISNGKDYLSTSILIGSLLIIYKLNKNMGDINKI